jgi:hypothetical protein
VARRVVLHWVCVAILTVAGIARGQDVPRPLPPADVVAPRLPEEVPPPRTAFQRPSTAPPGTIIPDTPAIPPPLAPGGRELFLPNGTRVPLPGASRQIIRFAPRYDKINADIRLLDNDTQRLIFVGGMIVNVTYEKPPAKPGDPPNVEEMEFAADAGVVEVRGNGGANVLQGGVTTEPAVPGGRRIDAELYLTGNVIIRAKAELRGGIGPIKNTTNTLRADQVYYDVSEQRCIALEADLELATEGVKDTVHLYGKEVQRLGPNEWRALDAEAFASKLPSDPALVLTAREIGFTRRRVVRQNIFGIPYRDAKTGETEIGYEQILTGENVVGEYSGIPFFYLPYLRTDATDPLGPLAGLGFGNDRIFGVQAYTTWDMYKLLALRPPSGHRWRLHLDYLGDRGPGIGSDYFYTNTRGGLFGGRVPPPLDDDYALGRFTWDGPNRGESRLYGMTDGGVDNLGGFRGPSARNPGVRGRGYWFHDQDLMNDVAGYRWLRAQGQLAYMSDRDFREQFYKQEFDVGRNLESYAYLNGATNNLGGSLLLQGNFFRPWVTEAQSLPRMDGYWIGQSFFNDLFVYSARGSAGYFRFLPTEETPFPVMTTDQQRIDLGRFDLNHELAVPFDLGPFRATPYGVLDTAYYTEDLTGSGRGRLYGGGGVRASLPYSKFYADVDSELFNLKGLYHKGRFQLNYLYAQSNTDYSRLPQIDRLHDDTILQAYNYITPLQPTYVPGPDGVALANLPQYDPQRLAIRRLVEQRIDTLDDIHVLQLEQHHRLQTKRGFPGSEHTVDWLTIDTGLSIFPDRNRDNFGKTVGLMEYAALWNVGDRTSLSASGWIDPLETESRYYNLGSNFTRPDGTLFHLGYRQIDPIRSKAVTATIGYQLSRRYSTFISSTYDFGVQSALSNTVTLNRIGTDVTISMGFTYNAIVNNFGVHLTVIPNLAGLLGNSLGGRLVGNQALGLR